MKVGDTVWVFDVNRRVYPPTPPGKTFWTGGPIFRGHFKPVQIVGETRVSWVLGREGGTKINKKTLEGCFPTQAAVDEACWAHENRRFIVAAVERCSISQLREIATMLNVPDRAEPPVDEERLRHG